MFSRSSKGIPLGEHQLTISDFCKTSVFVFLNAVKNLQTITIQHIEIFRNAHNDNFFCFEKVSMIFVKQ